MYNTPQGTKLVYDFETDSDLLGDALSALRSGATPVDPRLKQQVEQLRILKTLIQAPISLDASALVQLGGLDQVSKALQASTNRKALIWITPFYFLGTGGYTKDWRGVPGLEPAKPMISPELPTH